MLGLPVICHWWLLSVSSAPERISYVEKCGTSTTHTVAYNSLVDDVVVVVVNAVVGAAVADLVDLVGDARSLVRSFVHNLDGNLVGSLVANRQAAASAWGILAENIAHFEYSFRDSKIHQGFDRLVRAHRSTPTARRLSLR